MKKYCLLVVLICLTLNNCSVQKNYYIFDWYRPGKDSTRVAHSQQVQKEIPDTSGTQDVFLPDQISTANVEQGPGGTIRLKPVDQTISNGIEAQKSPFETSPGIPETSATKAEPFVPKMADTILLAVLAFIGIVAVGFTHLFRPLTTTITRWAKANPKKTQGLIACSHLSLLSLGVVNGYSLNQMGYEVSDALLYGLCGATAIGFLSTPLMPTHQPIIIPKKLNRHRLGYAAITLSTLMLMVGFGNRIEKNHPGTPLHQTVQSIDQSIFSSDNTDPVSKAKTKGNRLHQDRKAKAGISIAGAIGLSILLFTMVCAGICLIAGLFGVTGPGYVIGGILLLVLAVFGLIQVDKARKARKAEENSQKQ